MKKSNFYCHTIDEGFKQNGIVLLEEKFDNLFIDNSIYKIIPDIIKNIKSYNKYQNKKTISNLYCVYGPKKSGKSTLLRGEIGSCNNKGVILEIIKEANNFVIGIIDSKEDMILLKFGMVASQNNKVFNLVSYFDKSKSYFDEIINTNNNDISGSNIIYIKNITSQRDIPTEIENCLKRRDDILDLDTDYTLYYQYIIEVKNKNLETNLILQFDFVEINTNMKNMNFIPNLIENLISSKFLREKNILLERFIYRHIINHDFINFILCFGITEIENLAIGDFLKTTNTLKSLVARQDLLKCERCDLNETIKKKKKEQLKLIDELEKITDDMLKISKSFQVENNKKMKLILQDQYTNLNKKNLISKLDGMIMQTQVIFQNTKSSSTVITKCICNKNYK